jgi:phosphohistidine swiveling domain-containing protein
MWIRPLARTSGAAPVDARCGAKAHGLAELRAAGLPVPEGFVLTDEAFRAVVGEANLPTDVDHLGHALDQLARAIEASEPPPELAAEVAARVRRLGKLAVRSSISLEDRGAGAAAGVFSSRLAVAPDDVWPAIRSVWASVCTPLAAAYARHRRGERAEGSPLTVAVIVQRYVPGARITVYTRPPGQPGGPECWLERGEVLHKLPRPAERGAEPRAANATADALALALRAERALGLAAGGADVELIEVASDAAIDEELDAASADPPRPVGLGFRPPPRPRPPRLAVVQARPIVHPPLAVRVPAPPLLVSALAADGRRWTADLAHNPDPLSPAQAGLIERIEREAASPYSLRLCAGYLYSAPRELRPVSPPASAEELQRRFAAIEQRAATALGEPTPHDLPATLDAFLRFYRIWAYEMSPLVGAARLAAVAQSSAEGHAQARPARPRSRRSAVDAMVMACARGEVSERELFERIGDLSPAWDVAVPSLAETPEWIATALARARALPLPPADAAAPAASTLADLAFELAELDDVWFAHAQARVRRALLVRGAELGLGNDVFWLPLDEILAARAAASPEAPSSSSSPPSSPPASQAPSSPSSPSSPPASQAPSVLPASQARPAPPASQAPPAPSSPPSSSPPSLAPSSPPSSPAAPLDAPSAVPPAAPSSPHTEPTAPAAPAFDPELARGRAAAARAAHRRASAWRMPEVVGGVMMQAPRWRGVGCGGTASGRVVHIHNLWELPVLPLGAIAVTPAVTPALAVALVGAAAIVSETGGLLDHGAAMARELGIPCVVGCTDAMSLPAHALVMVDGDAGSVTALESNEALPPAPR